MKNNEFFTFFIFRNFFFTKKKKKMKCGSELFNFIPIDLE